MKPELERYLLAIVIVLSLNAGLLVTQMLTSAVSMSLTFWIIPPVVGLLIGVVVMTLAGSIVWESSGHT